MGSEEPWFATYPFFQLYPQILLIIKLSLWKQHVALRARRKCDVSVPPVLRASMSSTSSLCVSSCWNPSKPWSWESCWCPRHGCLTGHSGHFCQFLWAQELPWVQGGDPSPCLRPSADSTPSGVPAFWTPPLPIAVCQSASAQLRICVALVLPGNIHLMCQLLDLCLPTLCSLKCHVPFLCIATYCFLERFLVADSYIYIYILFFYFYFFN